jgi:hypothetical protein
MYVQIFIPYLFEKHNKKFEERESILPSKKCWANWPNAAGERVKGIP